MSKPKVSKIFKVRIENLEFQITIDQSLVLEKTENSPTQELVLDEYDFLSMHFHPMYELFLVTDIPFTVFQNKTAQEFKDSIVLIPPFLLHTTAGNNIYRLLISIKQLDTNLTHFSKTFLSFFNHSKISSLQSSPFQYHCCKKLDELLYQEKSSLNEEICNSILKLLLFDIYSHNVDTSISNKNFTPTEESYLLILEEHIQMKYSEDITLQYLADLLHLSTKQTSRIIQKHYKLPLSELLTNRRLEIARLLLTNTNNSIAKIIQHINFHSESYFFSQFKKKFGCTPREYRKRYKK